MIKVWSAFSIHNHCGQIAFEMKNWDSIEYATHKRHNRKQLDEFKSKTIPAIIHLFKNTWTVCLPKYYGLQRISKTIQKRQASDYFHFFFFFAKSEDPISLYQINADSDAIFFFGFFGYRHSIPYLGSISSYMQIFFQAVSRIKRKKETNTISMSRYPGLCGTS